MLSKAGHKELKVHTVYRGRHLTVNLDKYSCGTERHTLGTYNVTKLATSWTQDWVTHLTDGKNKFLDTAQATGWTVRPSNPDKGKRCFLPQKSLRLWGPVSLLLKAYRGSFHWVRGGSGRDVKLATHIHWHQTVRMSGAMPLLLHTRLWDGQGQLHLHAAVRYRYDPKVQKITQPRQMRYCFL